MSPVSVTEDQLREFIFLGDGQNLDDLGLTPFQVAVCEFRTARGMVASGICARYEFPTDPRKLIGEHILHDFLCEAPASDKWLVFAKAADAN